MFSHIMIGTNDLERARAFYDSLLGTLGVAPARVDGHRIFYRTPTGAFSVTNPINGGSATCANGMTIGFAAASTAEADAWHAAGVAAGGTPCEEPPGVREGSVGKLYLASLSPTRHGCAPITRRQRPSQGICSVPARCGA